MNEAQSIMSIIRGATMSEDGSEIGRASCRERVFRAV